MRLIYDEGGGGSEKKKERENLIGFFPEAQKNRERKKKKRTPEGQEKQKNVIFATPGESPTIYRGLAVFWMKGI
jgi:hypothetical protein